MIGKHRIICIFSFLSVLLDFVLANTDYYNILNVTRNADNRELKKAYLRLSKKWHPDKNGGDEKMFRDITYAYQVLSNPEKRKIYDTHGEKGLKWHEEGKGSEYYDPFDLFSKIFENHFQGVKRGPDMEKIIEVELEELYYGSIVAIDVSKQIICSHCQGSGLDPKHKHSVTYCSKCNGQGILIVRHTIMQGFIQTYQIICDACSGQGQVVSHPCTVCNGNKVVRGTEKYTLNIPAGAPYGYKFVFKNEADESPDWEAGDLYIIIAEKLYSKSGWMRKNNDLYRVETISLLDALLGEWTRKIKLFSHDYFNVTKPAGHTIQSGHVDVFPGKGMPIWDASRKASHSNKGNAYIEWKVILPELKLNDPLRKSLQTVFQHTYFPLSKLDTLQILAVSQVVLALVLIGILVLQSSQFCAEQAVLHSPAFGKRSKKHLQNNRRYLDSSFKEKT
ncbi:hypothetical protein PORY_002397 [Pneumocystis oryctolagi]|uniref:Uncharacterized protein n=1 Tax=Pneumocystis oryctolagi TaxID=42067 RepID=A0ACB7C962_9ASCO|nr:hypothetical protein PORY_002397 [Pneumocystis oryctolagi]